MSSQLNIKKIAGLTSGVGSHTLTLETGGADRVTVTNTAITLAGATTISNTATISGNIVPGTANTYTLGTSSAAFASAYLGSGVYIGGTTSANLLDDYEEGTWTPSITGETGTITTVSSLSATYTKVGDTVYVFCRFQVTDKGTGSNFTISGLPFAGARELLGLWSETNTTGLTGFMFTASTGATSFLSRRADGWGNECLVNGSYSVNMTYRV